MKIEHVSLVIIINGPILIDCGLYSKVLKPPSILSLTLQGSDLDIVLAMKKILKTSDPLKSLMQLEPLQWPTMKLVLDRLKYEGYEKIYQGAVLKNYSFAAIEFCKKEALADLKRVEVNMRQCLEWSDVKLLRALLVFIETQSWIKKSTTDADDECEDASMLEIKLALEDIFRVFIDPLQMNNVSLSTDHDDTVDCARRYLSIESAKYRKVWYLLHTCPNVEKWPSVLLLCELVFSLPFSNGRVEQIFSSLKVSKPSNRTSLQTSTLDDLLEISIEEPPLSSLSADCAIDLWRSDCRTTRRMNQTKRKPYRPRSSTPTATSLTNTIGGESQELDDLTFDSRDEYCLVFSFQLQEHYPNQVKSSLYCLLFIISLICESRSDIRVNNV